MPDEKRSGHLTDPRAMRALAHPTRLRLLGALRTGGPSTVGRLCAVVDEAPGSVSYHLTKLAEHGFVEEVPELARDGRERWWRAARERTAWSPLEVLADPERRAASNVLRRAIWRRYLEQLEEYLEVEPQLDQEWVDAMASSDNTLHLTAPELAQVGAELDELMQRWEGRSNPDRPGAEQVRLIFHAFPLPLESR